jgi:hypothetical protein
MFTCFRAGSNDPWLPGQIPHYNEENFKRISKPMQIHNMILEYIKKNELDPNDYEFQVTFFDDVLLNIEAVDRILPSLGLSSKLPIASTITTSTTTTTIANIDTNTNTRIQENQAQGIQQYVLFDKPDSIPISPMRGLDQRVVDHVKFIHNDFNRFTFHNIAEKQKYKNIYILEHNMNATIFNSLSYLYQKDDHTRFDIFGLVFLYLYDILD